MQPKGLNRMARPEKRIVPSNSKTQTKENDDEHWRQRDPEKRNVREHLGDEEH